MKLATPEAFADDPETVTRWYDFRRAKCLDAIPNPGHLALARMQDEIESRGGSFTLLTAFIVAEVGPIGFVGLVVPHTVRAFTGPRHRILLPVSMLGGGAFLCACDLAARRLGEMPIGIVTTMIGAPFFLFLLMRGRFTDWDA